MLRVEDVKSIVIILPNWLGDAIMTTPAIEALCEFYPHASLTLVGSYVSIEAMKHHPFCHRSFVDNTKKGFRFYNTYKLAKSIGKHDIAISFRNQFYPSLLAKLTGSTVTIAREKWHSKLLLKLHPKASGQHLVQKYLSLVETLTQHKIKEISPLRLFVPKHPFERPTLGLNPGATYGSAKRWYPEKFAAVAAAFSAEYDIVIFGGPSEVEMASSIEEELQKLKITNYTNLAGKTSVEELLSHIGGLELFITNDSGPMHVAAAYQVPTVAIFGPTKHLETSQWKNRKSVIVRHDMECAPCMKRECPLGHHECMKLIEAEEVIAKAKELMPLAR